MAGVMMKDRDVIMLDQFCCPRCHARVQLMNPTTARCTMSGCHYCEEDSFPVIDNIPVLIDFENSVITKEGILASGGASVVSRGRSSLFEKVRRIIRGESVETARNAALFLDEVRRSAQNNAPDGARKPTILVIGGGTRREGIAPLFESDDVTILSFDVYISQITDFVADGHQIPLREASIDGVWIEAVLEHVLEPHTVTAEIFRILKRGAIVYAETPFMQQVHEAAYDFTRFTHSGHRWLFRRFEEVTSGVTAGPGTSLIWSSRYFWLSLTGSRKFSALITLPIFWLRFFDSMASKKGAIDGANGVYFMGRKSEQTLNHKQIIAYYNGNLT